MKNLVLLVVLVLSSPLIADEGHNHEAAVEAAPQGGTLRDAPPFKAEITIEGETVKLTVYDQKLKVVKYDAESLTGDIRYPRGFEPKEQKLVFKKVKLDKPITIKDVGVITERYEGTVKGISKPGLHRYDLHINLAVGGKKAMADFGIDNIN